MTMTKKELDKALREWGILLEEEMNIALDTNWGQKFKWETAVAFECMIDEVDRVNTVIDLHDEIVTVDTDMLLFVINENIEDIPLSHFDKDELLTLKQRIEDELKKDRGY